MAPTDGGNDNGGKKDNGGGNGDKDSTGNNNGGDHTGKDTALVIVGFTPDSAYADGSIMTITGKHFLRNSSFPLVTIGGVNAPATSANDSVITVQLIQGIKSGSVTVNGVAANKSFKVLEGVSDYPLLAGKTFTLEIDSTHVVEEQVTTWTGSSSPTSNTFTFQEFLLYHASTLVYEHGELYFLDSVNKTSIPGDLNVTGSAVSLQLDATSKKIATLIFRNFERIHQAGTKHSDTEANLELHNLPYTLTATGLTADLNGDILNDPAYVRFSESVHDETPYFNSSTTLKSWTVNGPKHLHLVIK